MIKTPRLILRPPKEQDIEPVHKAINKMWDELQKWMSWSEDGANTKEAVATYIERTKSQYNEGSLPIFGFDKNTNDFVVASGLVLLENKEQKEFCTGYWVSKAHWGNGYAQEAANACIRYGFKQMGATMVHTDYYEGNEKSRKIIEKLGFTHSQTLSGAHKRFFDDRIVDVHHYVMLDPSVLPPLTLSY
jgi:RimJ/RimL family protein N-acetyltransferase